MAINSRGVSCASRRRTTAGLALGLLLLAAPACAADAIEVHGNRRVEAATIQSYFAPRAGEGGRSDRLDEKSVDAGLKALYASGLFTDAQVPREGGRLIVTVVEAPVIDRIAYEGNHSLKDKDLQGETQSKARGALVQSAVQADVVRLTELYRHAGRFDARVVPKTVAHG